MNKLMWVKRIALGTLLSVALHAQAVADFPVPESDAPPDVAQALRDRVKQFFDYHVGVVNRRAIELVAEDTKDYYFASGKVQFLGFKITELAFARDFQKASVRLETTQTWQIQQYSTAATTPVVTSWKIEDGKWVWYLDNQVLMQSATPMGASAPPPDKASIRPEALVNADGTVNLPPDFAEPTRVAAQGQAILSQGGLDKNSVTFAVGSAGQDQVTFHNGFGGQVSLELHEVPKIPGLTVKLSKTDLAKSEDGIIQFVYAPPADAPPTQAREYTLRLGLVPFNREFPIKLMMQPAR